MSEVDPSGRADSWRTFAVVSIVAGLIHGCGAARPCQGSAWCPDGAVCGLGGECIPRPSVEETRFVKVRALAPRAARVDGEVVDTDRWSLGGRSRKTVELHFSPLPEGEVTMAVLRLSPYPGVSAFEGEAVAVVRRGRHRAAVRHSVGTSSPLLVDVTPLIRDADRGEPFTLVLSVRADVPFVVASSSIADPARRPSLDLVQR